jgi:DNA repair exonuclease SbcCD ATPase subunit
VIKRLFGLGKLQFYADVAKERLQESETAIEKLRNKSSQIQNDLDSAESKKSKAEQARDTFTSEKKAAIDKCENKITELMESKGQIVDIEEIEKSWETITIAKNKSEQLQHKIDNANQFIESTNGKINALKSQKSELETEIHKIETSIRLKEEQWDAWEQKRDSVCPTCETPLTGQYIDDKVREKKAESAEEIAQLNASGAELHQQLKSVQDEISENEHKRDLISSKMDRIVAKKRQLDDSIKQTTNGKVTINEAKSHNNYVRNVEERIQDQRNLVRELESQKNPHDKTVKEIELQIHDLKSRKDDQESQLRSEEERASHIQFIYKAYSDKRNIRAFILSSHLPLLNSRLSYYMNEMDLGRDMQFDHLLNMKSDKWDYDDHSGGERKRIDLALMCALYDTAQSIHGRTSNLLVLDEIDKELDSQGVDDYVHLIMDDLANRIPTILVISHKEEICHAFPLQIKVNNDGESVLLNGT